MKLVLDVTLECLMYLFQWALCGWVSTIVCWRLRPNWYAKVSKIHHGNTVEFDPTEIVMSIILWPIALITAVVCIIIDYSASSRSLICRATMVAAGKKEIADILYKQTGKADLPIPHGGSK